MSVAIISKTASEKEKTFSKEIFLFENRSAVFDKEVMVLINKCDGKTKEECEELGCFFKKSHFR